MGSLADAFAKEDRTEVAFSDFYRLMRESEKAELLMNAAKCDVPTWYINAMATGKLDMPNFEEGTVIEVQEEETTDEWGVIASAVREILDEWADESQAAEMVKHIHAVVEEVAKTKISELRMKQYTKWAAENEKTCPKGWSCRTCINGKEETDPACQKCEDGSGYRESEGRDNGND